MNPVSVALFFMLLVALNSHILAVIFLQKCVNSYRTTQMLHVWFLLDII